MAVSIDRVYQTVLALANKEQRGYITPQEFNLFANHAQMDIFDQYFYDLDSATSGLKSTTRYADKSTDIQTKISLFERYMVEVTCVNQYGDIPLAALNIYRLGLVSVMYNETSSTSLYSGRTGRREWAEEMDLVSAEKYDSPLGANSKKSKRMGTGIHSPLYIKYYAGENEMRIKIRPYPLASRGDDVRLTYVEKPISPNWTYNIVGENALFNPNNPNFRNFALHSSEENNLVLKILQLAGISIKDYQLAQVASQEDMINKQEKQ